VRTHTHDLFAYTYHSPLTTHHRKDFSGTKYNGKITKRSFEGLSSEAKARYKVVYEDDDEEELYAEEIVPLLQVRVRVCVRVRV